MRKGILLAVVLAVALPGLPKDLTQRCKPSNPKCHPKISSLSAQTGAALDAFDWEVK